MINKPNIYTLFFLVFILFSSCDLSDKNVKNGKLSTISLNNLSSEKLNLKSLRLIHLKDNPYSQIVNIEKIIQVNDSFIISDKMVVNAVYIYDFNGNYINHIYGSGEGPGEYRFLREIFYNEKIKRLCLFPMDLPKEMHYAYSGQSDPLSALQSDPPELSNFFGQE